MANVKGEVGSFLGDEGSILYVKNYTNNKFMKLLKLLSYLYKAK